MSEMYMTTVRQRVSRLDEQPMWAVYNIELTQDLNGVLSKELDFIEYRTADKDGVPFTLVLDAAEAKELVRNLTAVLEANR